MSYDDGDPEVFRCEICKEINELEYLINISQGITLCCYCQDLLYLLNRSGDFHLSLIEYRLNYDKKRHRNSYDFGRKRFLKQTGKILEYIKNLEGNSA